MAVHLKITEGTRERVQVFKGTVLYKHNNGVGSSFTVRRVASNGIGVERTFLTHSPKLEKVVVERHSKFAVPAFISCVNAPVKMPV